LLNKENHIFARVIQEDLAQGIWMWWTTIKSAVIKVHLNLI
jgi:hypothetical protein